MLCIRLQNNDPYFCLAAEEYLLRNFEEDIFLLWQSHNAVVVGKHQNLMGEINYPFCIKNNISLARRISGGGTVFHDAGNVNFSYIKNVANPAGISFKMFTQPIVDALAKLGLKVTTSGRNDLQAEGKKISGNAEHIFKNRVLHHGTLLFSSDLKNLGQAIKIVPGKYQSKAVRSIKSEVANISSFLKKQISIEEFIRFLLNTQLEKRGSSEYRLNETDKAQTTKLAEEKYTTWDWILGYSPAYSFQNKTETDDKTLEVKLKVKKGIIQECRISGDYFTGEKGYALSLELQGKRHDYTTIGQIINKIHSYPAQKNSIENFF